jgi:acyl-CoA reductase-like NAD-dependent aldehyde dehydrogenase
MIQLPYDSRPLLTPVATFLAKPHAQWINGCWQASQSGARMWSQDPSSGTHLAQFSAGSEADIDAAVTAAHTAFDDGPWRRMAAAERSAIIWKFADLLDGHKDVLAQLDCLDTGKPFSKAMGELDYSIAHFRYFAGWPTKIEGTTIPVNPASMLNYTLREPVGVCGLITPWNYPMLMAAWKLAPALAAGNCIIHKPAENTVLSALYMAELSAEAGFPAGVFNVVTGAGSVVGRHLVAHPQVNKIGFTGSGRVAYEIVRESANDFKRVSLELGGKSANILFADADLEQAIPSAAWALFGNNGQSCTAGARLYVQRPVLDKVLQGLEQVASGIRVGPGMSREDYDLGPVISAAQQATVLDYIESGRRAGGEFIAGGNKIGGDLENGFFIAPTVIYGLSDDARMVREEIFGPVLSVHVFDDTDEVLARANDTPFGLAAGLWTSNLGRAHAVAARLQAGTIWVNTWGNTDAASPFGGFKQSGQAREMGRDAIELYTETKSVWVPTHL